MQEFKFGLVGAKVLQHAIEACEFRRVVWFALMYMVMDATDEGAIRRWFWVRRLGV